MHCACAVLSSVACLTLQYFPTLSHKLHDFRKKKKKLAASSMQHEAKIAYYAFDVIRFFVPYAARLKLRGRVAR